MDYTKYLLAFVGGLMIGIAILLFVRLQSSLNIQTRPAAQRGINPWTTIALFAVGVPLGAICIKMVTGGDRTWPIISLTIIGLVVATAITLFVIGSSRRRK